MKNPIVKKIKNQLRNLKSLSEALEVQMALGKAEAKDLVEQEKDNLTSFINKEISLINAANTNTAEDSRVFLTAVENLETALNATIPTDESAYDKYKNGILKTIYELEEILKDKYENIGDETRESLDSFKNKMDAFRVNLALHDKDDPKRVARVKQDFSEELHDVRASLSENETDQHRLNQFVEDISESFKYLRRAVDNLSN